MSLVWHGDELLKLIRDGTEPALWAIAQQYINDAAAHAPKRSGTLSESGYTVSAKRSSYKANKQHYKELKGVSDKPGETEVWATFAAFYAGFFEFGTKHLPAKPFMRPALDGLKNRAGDILKAKFKGVIP